MFRARASCVCFLNDVLSYRGCCPIERPLEMGGTQSAEWSAEAADLSATRGKRNVCAGWRSRQRYYLDPPIQWRLTDGGQCWKNPSKASIDLTIGLGTSISSLACLLTRPTEGRRNFKKLAAQHYRRRNAEHITKRASEVSRVCKIGIVRGSRRGAFSANRQHGAGQFSPEQIAPKWQS